MKNKHTRRRFLGVAGAGMLLGPSARGGEAAPDTSAVEARTPADEIEWTRRVPLRYEADVAVIGVGTPGTQPLVGSLAATPVAYIWSVWFNRPPCFESAGNRR